MKKINKIILAVGLFALPVFTFAAYNDVSLQTGGVISSNGINIDVSGTDSVIESITVNSGSFTMQMRANSYVKLSVPTYNQLSYEDSYDTGSSIEYTCNASNSVLQIRRSDDSQPTTITVTPSSTICSNSTTSSGNGGIVGGGGGGGGSYTYIPPVTATTSANTTGTLQAQLLAMQSQLAGMGGSAKSALTLRLTLGSTGPEVKILQQILNTDPETQVSLSGAGSPGNETTLFGGATLAALKKFQVKWGIVSEGNAATTGFGATGPMTRAKLNAFVGGTATVNMPATPTTPSVTGAVAKRLTLGSTGPEVKILQQILNTDPETQVSLSGAGSPGT